MSLKVKAVARKNPLEPASAVKYYATAISSGKVGIDELAQGIANASTMSRADIYGVIVAMVDEIVTQLAEGKIIEMGKLGTLRMTVNSGAAESAEKVTSSLVKKINVRFRVGADIANKVKSIKVEKVSAS
ncbi:MAG TPA: DNA-binding domain-containing protein [Bacteroidales bacterium]|nr:DNA-binding domain-containing protein [Bacteroidales bacterium]